MSASFARGIEALRRVIDAPTAAFFSSCVHCGLCAEACLFYTETGDPQYTPIHKLEPLRRLWRQEFTLGGRLAKALGLVKPVSDAELAEWSVLAYDSCTLCGRCFGNDIATMVRKFREGLAAAGHAPKGLIGATTRAITIGSPMGVKWKAVLAQIGHVEADTGLRIPVDVEGADYLCLMSSMEIINFPEYLAALTRIFAAAGVSWTLSEAAFEATNSGIQIGASDLARDIVERIVVAAERLKSKCVVSPECGHAFTALRWEGPNLIGRPYPFADAWSSGTMVRGLELILQGRDPREAWAIAQRICGVCTVVHGIASVRAVEAALGIKVPANAELIRNLMIATQYAHDHVMHFYHLHALDWVDVVSALNADAQKTSTLAQSISRYAKSSPGYFEDAQAPRPFRRRRPASSASSVRATGATRPTACRPKPT